MPGAVDIQAPERCPDCTEGRTHEVVDGAPVVETCLSCNGSGVREPVESEPDEDMIERSGNSFRDGKVHVCSRLCDTCVFRPGNLMSLNPGRLREMVEEARRSESGIVCHSTLGTGANAVCRGFYDRYPTQPLQIASRLGRIRWQEPPTKGLPA